MDSSFWRGKWERGETAFHESEANPMLVAHFQELALPEGSRVFVPLCGKTLDIAWLLARGCRVAGAELSEIAVGQLFEELGVEPEITDAGRMKRYRASDLDIFVGDIFDLSGDMLGAIDAVYDRAALVALPEPVRERYARHLGEISGGAPQLLISYEYDQRLAQGPPFSISPEEIARRYGDSHDLKPLASAEVKGGIRGEHAATESVWLLKRKRA